MFMPPTDEPANAPASTTPTSRLNTVVAWGIALLGTAVCAFIVSGSLKHFGSVNDLPEYYAGGKLLLENRAREIFDLQRFYEYEKQLFPMLTRGIGLFLPPLAVPLLVPITLIPVELAPQLWTAILSLALVAAIFLLAKYFGLQRQSLAWLIGLTMLSGPACEALRIGQLAPILLLALVGVMHFAAREKWLAAGLVLAVFVLKPQQMFPLVIYLIGARRFRLLFSAAGAIVALTLLSLPFFGMDGYMDYAKVVTDKANLIAMQPELNATIRGQVLRFSGYASNVPTIVGIAALLGFSAFAFLLGRRYKDDPRWIEAGLAGAMPLGLATSMHCHDYDLLLLIPGLVALAMRLFDIGKWTPILVAVAGATFLQPFYAEIHYNYLKTGAPINPHFIGLFLAALACGLAVWRAGATIELSDEGNASP
jgi:hypothetical protein